MTVIDKRRYKLTRFKDLKQGDTFLNDIGDLCMKINNAWDSNENCVDAIVLKNGVHIHYMPYVEVSPVDATITFVDG